MKTNLGNKPDYMSDPKLYRAGKSIDWITYGLRCRAWFGDFEKELREYHTFFSRQDTWSKKDLIKEILGEEP